MIGAGIVGWVDRSDRERTIVTGQDRVKLLNNLCTNDVKRLKAGQGCETFVTSPQGKTLGWIAIHDRDDDFLIRADAGGLALVTPHCTKYGVFDDVAFADAKAETFEIHYAGEAADVLLAAGFPPGALPADEDLRSMVHAGPIGDVTLLRESPFGPAGITVIGPTAWRDAFLAEIGRHLSPDARQWTRDEAEGMRIAAGTPRFGSDITPDNLPQEVARDARAISFVKGCYLGQETVARLDALGHVNKVLRRIVVTEGEPPAVGAALVADGNPVGVVTSSGRMPDDDKPVVLAMVRVKPAPAGTVIAWDKGRGQITDVAS